MTQPSATGMYFIVDGSHYVRTTTRGYGLEGIDTSK